AREGSMSARHELLVMHRERLRRMVAVHIDRRLAARLDPSDVVQEALMDAAAELSDYLERRPVAFYPWLRTIAWERLVKLHRRHLKADKRSVKREERSLPLPDESALDLAKHLAGSGTGPTGRLLRKEVQGRVRVALGQLGEIDRQILVMRYLEQLSI